MPGAWNNSSNLYSNVKQISQGHRGWTEQDWGSDLCNLVFGALWSLSNTTVFVGCLAQYLAQEGHLTHESTWYLKKSFCCKACGILVPQLGIEPRPPALEAESYPLPGKSRYLLFKRVNQSHNVELCVPQFFKIKTVNQRQTDFSVLPPCAFQGWLRITEDVFPPHPPPASQISCFWSGQCRWRDSEPSALLGPRGDLPFTLASPGPQPERKGQGLQGVPGQLRAPWGSPLSPSSSSSCDLFSILSALVLSSGLVWITTVWLRYRPFDLYRT